MRRQLALAAFAVALMAGGGGAVVASASADETALERRGAVLESQRACGDGLVFDAHVHFQPSAEGAKNPSAEAAVTNFLSDIYPGIKDLPRRAQAERGNSHRFEVQNRGRTQLILDVERNGDDDWVIAGYTACDALLAEGRKGGRP